MITLPQHSLIALLKQLGVAALYALLLYVGARHFEGGNIVGYFEPASGLALAALLIGGKRYAWGVLLGAALIHAITDDSLWEAVIVASGDTLQALCGAWLLTRDGKFDLRLQLLRDYLRLILLGGCASIAIGALAVSTTLLVSGLLAPANYFHRLIQWWMSDTLGVILIAPLIMLWREPGNNRREAGQMAEAALMLGLTILAGQAVFLDWWHDSIGFVAKGYWIFLIVTWVAVRIGSCGTVIVLVMTATYALLGAIQGVGFFADDIAQTHLANYWLFMVTLSVVGMALATHLTEHKQLEQQLSRRLRYRDVMDRISRISLSSATIEELLGKALDEILTVFNADRAYFLYPCDPDAPSWSVPFECTRPEWPGAFASGMAMPMTPEVAEVFREVLASTKPLSYGPAASRCIPAAEAEQFSIRSMIQMALRPRVGSSWVMGLHHCAQAQAYDEDDLLIFKDIGRRVADAMSSMIILKKLLESETKLHGILDNAPVGIWLVGVDKRYRFVNKTFCDAVGIAESRFLATTNLPDLLGAEIAANCMKSDQECLAKETPHISYEELPFVDGKRHLMEITKTKLRDSTGLTIGAIGIAMDITERKNNEDLLRESESNLRAILDNMQDLFYRTDQCGRVIMVSPSVKATSGYEQEDVIGRQVTDFYADPEVRAGFLKKLEENGGVLHGYEVALRHKDGHLVWASANSHFYLDRNGNVAGVEGALHDITGRKQAEEQIRNLAFYDTLTQLPNRRLLNDRLEQTMAASKRSSHYGALMFLDLDNFKPLNDMHGHVVGDLLLVEVAHRLTGCVREVDTVARFGGDEFVVMLGELDAGQAESIAQARIVAEKIRSTLAEPYVLKTQQEGKAEMTVEHHCAASIGVVVFNSEAGMEDILKWADTAMYQAKEGGRNMIRFSDEVNS